MIARPFVVGGDTSAHASVHHLALDVLTKAGEHVRLIDDVEAEMLFEEAAAPLLAMEQELLELQIDPEVPGLRSPERFLDSAFRLQRNLSEALLSPETFLERSLSGATEFYAKPPNFAHPELIAATKNEHRNALAVSSQELQRQYRREVDLAKLLAQLFRAYANLLRERGSAPGRDLVARALECVRTDAALAEKARVQYAVALVDDTAELTVGERALLQAVFGTIERAVPQATHPRPRVEVFRAETQVEEARWIATRVANLIEQHARPGEIAVLLRSASVASAYEEALLDRNVPVHIAGDFNPFADRRALDALALLWNVHDPFRHDWLLRTLEGSALALSDASLATLCGDSTERQTALFEEAAPTEAAHHDPERSVRLARNVLSGECDHALSPLARVRIERFRAMRERWVEAQRRLAFEDFARLVWSEGLAREGMPGSARAQAQQRALQSLLSRMSAYLATHPGADVAALLADVERRAESDLESCEADSGEDAVLIASVEAVRGHGFEHVIVANVRPGAFPRWYAADVFHFSPKLGVIPRDNVGDAPTARTAKFTYYMYRAKAREKYNARDRRLFEYALSRARSTLCVTAWGRPTRAVSAPEFLEELR